MTKLNTKTDAQVTWEAEMAYATEIMGKVEKDNLYKLDRNTLSSHINFLKFVELKKSFHDQAEDMVKWITKELSKDHGLVEDFAYFMDRGYMINKPDRWDFRSAVFNDLKEAIVNDLEFDIYEIVRKWDMWYHS